MLRIFAVIAAVVAIILFAVFALNDAHPLGELGWGLVALAASLGLFELEGVSVPGPR